jgi:hypothetical protein
MRNCAYWARASVTDVVVVEGGDSPIDGVEPATVAALAAIVV